jgi:hypothetical protein
MEKTTARYKGYLGIYQFIISAQPKRGGPLAWEVARRGYKPVTVKNSLCV